MLDFCELFLCYSSSHTHIARLRSTFSILYMETASIIHITKPCCPPVLYQWSSHDPYSLKLWFRCWLLRSMGFKWEKGLYGKKQTNRRACIKMFPLSLFSQVCNSMLTLDKLLYYQLFFFFFCIIMKAGDQRQRLPQSCRQHCQFQVLLCLFVTVYVGLKCVLMYIGNNKETCEL